MKKIDFTKINKNKVEVSVTMVKPFIMYLEKKYSRKVTEQFVSETDISIDFLEDDKNWISYEYYTNFLDKIVQFTGNQHVLFESAEYILEGKAYAPIKALLRFLTHFGNPGMVFKYLEKLGSTISNIGKFKVLSLSKRRVILQSTLFPGYKQTKYNCNTIKGLAAMIPRYWKLPPGKVKEIKCAARGADSCVYEISWIPRPIRTIIFGFLSILLLVAEIIVHAARIFPFTKIEHIIFTAFGLFIFYLYRRIDHYKNIMKETKEVHEEHSQELEKTLENSRKEYTDLRDANIQIIEKANKLSILNYIAEEISKIDQEEELLFLIIKILIDCIGFDQGFFLSFNSSFTLIEEPGSIDKLTHKKQKNPDLEAMLKDKAGIQRIFIDLRPHVIKYSQLFNAEGKDSDILVIPIAIYNIFFYLIVFDNLISEQEIRDKNLQFFATVGRQLEIALNNIHSSKAAHNVLSSIPSMIIVFDKNSYRISYVNNEYLQYYNVKRNDVIGENILSVLGIPEFYRNKFLTDIDRLATVEFISDQEFQNVSKIIGYTIFKMPESMTSKNEIGIIMKDITKQKELQEQLIRGEKLAALGTLASGIAHEINNPLYGILGTAELMSDEAGDEKIKGYAKEIIDFTMQCSDIVKDLSSYSRSLREEQEADVEINSVLDEAVRIIRYNPKVINVEIEKDLDEVPSIRAIRGETRQIFMNIMNNAIQAMNGRGKLSLRTRLVDHYIEISIKDSGPGIPKEIQSKIFDPFFTTKGAGEGIGIGLNIVYRLVTKYNGFVTVSSEENKGAEFVIRFPVKEKV